MAARQWITVERFRDLSEAIVARSALEAAGISCFLRDENTVRMDWQVSNFIGGMRLQVPDDEVVTAKAVLAGLEPDTVAVPDGGEACPRCGSSDVHREAARRRLSLALVFLVGLPLPQGKQRWTCSNCGHHWDDWQEAA